MSGSERSGRVARVAGPLVEVESLGSVSMFELVEVGSAGAPGEIVAITPDHVVVQVYEETAGLGVGDSATASGRLLSVPLGPGLLGGIYDGLLRPLGQAPDLLVPGWDRAAGRGAARSWRFVPAVAEGTTVAPGEVLGTVAQSVGLDFRALVPPGARGTVRDLADGPVADDAVIARVGGTDVPLTSWWPVRHPRPVAGRLPASAPLLTGQRAIDLLFPLARGSTAAVPGGFGTGKTMLLQQVAKWCDADVIVYVGCGERGNEMAEVLTEWPDLEDPRTGRSLSERTVIVVSTSNMPVMAREASVYTGITIGEHFRDMGYAAVVIADSTSRWAQALREFAARTGELPTEEGFPASLASTLASFYERAGRVRTLGGDEADATIVAAVSPPGGDRTEPVTSHTQRFVRGLWSLDRDLAAGRHYPAVSWRDSFSRDAEVAAAWHATTGDDPDWPRRREDAIALLAQADELEPVVQLVGREALPDEERVVLLAAELLREGVLQQNALSPNDAVAGPGKQAALLDMVLTLRERAAALVDRGVPAAIIEEADLSEAVRVREEAGPDDAASVTATTQRLTARLEALG